jgi:UDP-N-acetylmuramoyl-L-alanyl-D-glutamate--2,6-diaminopimelate ligase
LDYHGTFLEYLNAKKLFFDQLSKSSFALINEDDRHAKVMVQNTAAQVSTFGLKHLSDFKGRILENRLDGLLIRLNDKTISCRLSGEFNAYNLLAAFGTAILLGDDEAEVLSALSDCHPVRGRMEMIHDGMGRTGIVDFAHTPDALEKVLRTVIVLKDARRKMILVCGCGGDRDTSKRPIMGAIASSLADIVCFTSDNPRSENPETILQDMMAGVQEEHKSKVQIITSREQAIQVAVRLAGPGDVVVVAGKGHEDYQEIQGKRFPFDDKMVLKAALETSLILKKG